MVEKKKKVILATLSRSVTENAIKKKRKEKRWRLHVTELQFNRPQKEISICMGKKESHSTKSTEQKKNCHSGNQTFDFSSVIDVPRIWDSSQDANM